MVVHSLGQGGAEQAAVNLLPDLCSRGYDCELAVLWSPYDLAPMIEERSIVVHYLKLGRRWNVVAAVLRLARLIRRGNFDVVHAHLFFPSIYVAACRWLTPTAKLVVTFHGMDYDFHPVDTLRLRLRKALHAWLMRHGIHACSAVSTVVARHFECHLKLLSVRVIPNGLPIRDLQPHVRESTLGQAFTFVMPARLTPEKGHRYLLEAVSRLRERGLFPQILLYGDGPCQEAIERQIAQLNLQHQVIVRGALPHAVLLQEIQAADAFVLSSTHEGLPLAVAEAMALKLPVLVTDAGGMRDLVEDGVSGLVVPTADPGALADGMAQLMRDGALRNRLAAAGQQRVKTHFSTEQVATLWDEFYRAILKAETEHQ